MHKHKFRLKVVDRSHDTAIYHFECETCMTKHVTHTGILWPNPRARILRNLEVEYISITPTGMGQIISVTPQMVGDVKTAAKRDLLMRRRGW